MGWLTTLIADARAMVAAATGLLPGGGANLAVTPCAPPPAQMVKVGFTDKPKAQALFGGKRAQYVNLDPEAPGILGADSAAGSLNQLGHSPPIFIKVTPAAVTSVQVRLVAEEHAHKFPAGSATLSDREAALGHLLWAKTAHDRTTDAQGELLIEPGLPVSGLGGFNYRVEAAITGQAFVKGGNLVDVRRRVFIRPVVRFSRGQQAAVDAIAAVTAHLAKFDIEVHSAPTLAGAEMQVHEKSDMSDQALIDIGNSAMADDAAVKPLQPQCVAIIVGEFVTDVVTPVTFELEVSKPLGRPFPSTVNIDLTRDSVWYVCLPLHDASQVVSAEVQGHGLATMALRATELTGTDRFGLRVGVDLSRVLAAVTDQGILSVTLKLKAISGWAVGWAYNSHPVIYLNMRDPNTNAILAADKATALVIHELGHKLHLVAAGDGGQPDTQPHHYPSFDSHGVKHQGPHCSTGVAAGTDLWLPVAHNAATCTMWGALKDIKTFCPECQTALRKVDLSHGF